MSFYARLTEQFSSLYLGKSSKKSAPLLSILLIAFLSIGLASALYLVSTEQDVRQQAAPGGALCVDDSDVGNESCRYGSGVSAEFYVVHVCTKGIIDANGTPGYRWIEKPGYITCNNDQNPPNQKGCSTASDSFCSGKGTGDSCLNSTGQCVATHYTLGIPTCQCQGLSDPGDPDPGVSPGGGDTCSGSGAQCVVGMENCGAVGKDPGPGSCSNGGMCCVDRNVPPPPTATPKPQCGQTCQTNSDCAPSTGGAPVICHNNKCANANCPNDTANGSICFCKTPTGKCGDACGKNQLALCDRIGDENNPGSECGFIGNVNQCSESIANNQFCLPRVPQNGYTKRVCSGVQAYNLRRPDGGNVTTRAQVLESCFPQATATLTSTTTPVPTSTDIPAPICMSVSIANQTAEDPSTPPRLGHQISVTCGQVSTAQLYEFRVIEPDQQIVNLASISPSSRVSQAYTFTKNGNHKVQCRICNDLLSTQCSEWE